MKAIKLAIDNLGNMKSMYTKRLYVIHNIQLGELVAKDHPKDYNLIAASILLKCKISEGFLKEIRKIDTEVLDILKEALPVFTKKKFPKYSRNHRIYLEKLRLKTISRKAKILVIYNMYYTLEDIYKYDKNYIVVYAREALSFMKSLEEVNDKAIFIKTKNRILEIYDEFKK